MAKADNGKIIAFSSVKGGVGKTTMLLNFAGLYYLMNKKVLIIDLDLFSGGIATSLDIKNKKDIFMMVDSISNNRFTTLSDYVCSYNKGIDVLACPKDPRQALKFDGKYLPLIFDLAKKEYDIILVDTHHILGEVNLITIDNAYMNLFIVSNDLIDLKNMKSIISIFKDANKTNYLILLNNSRDTGKDYLSLFDIKNMIKHNIDYTVSKNFYIKNIDKYVMNGEILTLNKNIASFHGTDIKHMNLLAQDLISDNHKEEVIHHE